MKEMEIKGIIESGKLDKATTLGEIKEVLNISNDEFKMMWQYSYSSKNSAPEGTTDIDLQLNYQTDDKEFPEGCAKILINIPDDKMKDNGNMADWKINSVQIVF